jgi:hypothetical protein
MTSYVGAFCVRKIAEWSVLCVLSVSVTRRSFNYSVVSVASHGVRGILSASAIITIHCVHGLCLFAILSHQVVYFVFRSCQSSEPLTLALSWRVTHHDESAICFLYKLRYSGPSRTPLFSLLSTTI